MMENYVPSTVLTVHVSLKETEQTHEGHRDFVMFDSSLHYSSGNLCDTGPVIYLFKNIYDVNC